MSLAALSEDYLRHLVVLGRADSTVRNQRSHLRRFLTLLEGQGITEANQLGHRHVEQFVDELTWTPVRSGRPMKVHSRNVRLITVRGFARWLYDHDHTSINAAARSVLAKEPETLPRNVPSESDIEALIRAPNTGTKLGYRDRTILELLYATAVRVAELSGLDITDVDTRAGYAFIRNGKGGKDRVVPLGRRASDTLIAYLLDIRPQLAQASAHEPALLLNYQGTRLSEKRVQLIVARYAKRAGIRGRLTPHCIRHAVATHMIRRGAQLRHVQEMLGHAAVTSTEVYVQLTNQELLDSHLRYHPREQSAIS